MLKWEFPEIALGSAPEGAQEIGVLRAGAPEGAQEGAQGNWPEHPREHFPEHFQGTPTLAPL